MEPARYDINIYRDRDFSRLIKLENPDGTDTDLTGYSISAQIRERRDRASTLIATFSISTDVLTSGEFTLSLSDIITAAITQKRGWYDVELTTPAGARYNYLFGRVSISETVTTT